MASTVCLLTLTTGNGEDAQRAREKISSVVSDYFSDARPSADFNSRQELVESLNTQPESVHTAVIAAEPEQFTALKLTLMKTLSLRAVKSRAVAQAVSGVSFPGAREYDLQVAVPEKARVFISRDGLNSGFAFKKGPRCIIMLPLDCGRLDYMLANGLSSFLGELSAVSKRIAARAGLEACVKQTVELLAKNGSYIALSSAGSSILAQKCLRLADGFDKVFVVDLSPPPVAGREDIGNYIAVAAKTAKENTNADVGIAVSDICNDPQEGTAYTVVSVANSMRARVVKVYSEPGDDPKALVLAAIGKLLDMLGEFSSSEQGLVNPDKASQRPSPSFIKRLPVRGLVAVAACLLAAIAACVGVVYYLSGSGSYSGRQDSAYNSAATKTEIAGDEMDYNSVGYGGSMLQGDEMLPLPSSSALSSLETTTAPRGVLTAAMAVAGRQTVTASPVNTTTQQTASATAKATAAVTQSTAVQVITTVLNKITTTTAKPTAAPTTTQKPTTEKPTTEKPTTEKPTTATEKTTQGTASPSVSAEGGTFTFTVYGFGHGVGMSQDGAKTMAKNGATYQEIIKYYFPKTTLVTDMNPPATVRYGSADIPLIEYLCRTTVREIGDNAPTEALKAQLCAVYTYAKHYNFKLDADRHAYNASYQYLGTAVYSAALSYLNMETALSIPLPKYASYNGSAAFTCYFANAAGKTAKAESVWGGTQYPYLEGGIISPEEVSVRPPVVISAAELKKKILQCDSSIVLSDNPAEWLTVVSRAEGTADGIPGYVNTIRVGNKTMFGNAFRARVMDYSIRSHCFTFVYEP